MLYDPERMMTPAPRTGSERRRARVAGALTALLVGLAVAWPVWGLLGAGLISDDGPVLAYVHAHGPFADWFQTEYDARFFRFWRPLVTTTLDVQAALTGTAPVPLRLFNVLGLFVAALAAVKLARQLGASGAGALLVGILVAWFPYQGGTVVWIVGRVDSQCVPLALLALVAVLAGRAGWACLALFLALATKEVAIAVVPAAFALVAARRALRSDAGAASARGPLVGLVVTAAVVLVWRRLALGEWVGGYPGGLGAALGAGEPLAVLANIVRATAAPLAGLLVLVVVVALAGALLARRGTTRPTGSAMDGAEARHTASARAEAAHAATAVSEARHTASGATPKKAHSSAAPSDPEAPRLACAALWITLAGLAAMGPLVGNLVAGDLTAYHVRTTMLADALLCLVLAVCFVPRAPRALAHVGVLAFVVLGGLRAVEARADALEWGTAGDRSAALVAELRERVRDRVPEPRTEPVLTAALPRTHEGAYMFHWGVADRFRPPFRAATAPIWPWRPLFPERVAERTSATQVVEHLRWPFRDDLRTVPQLPVTVVASASDPVPLGPSEAVPVTAALLTEPGPLFVAEGTFPGARYEVLLFTELGFHAGTWGGPLTGAELGVVPEGAPDPPPFGGVLALRDLLQLEPGGPGSGGPYLYEALRLAADMGATEAYLELRVVDDARGQRHRPVATSRWIRLAWEPELRDVLAPR